MATNPYIQIKKIQQQVEDIKNLYNNLKTDIDTIPLKQAKIQGNRLLQRIYRISVKKLRMYVESLKRHVIYEDIKDDVESMIKDLDEIKEFIFPIIQKEDFEEDDDEAFKSSPLGKKLDYIRGKYQTLQKELPDGEISQLIKDTRRLESTISRLNYEDLPEGDYEELVDIKNNVSNTLKTLQGVEKSDKYGPYILNPLVDLIARFYTLGNKERAKNRANVILDFIEDPEKIHMFEPAIKRIIAKKMTAKEFKTFYESINSMIKGKQKFESFKNYKNKI